MWDTVPPIAVGQTRQIGDGEAVPGRLVVDGPAQRHRRRSLGSVSVSSRHWTGLDAPPDCAFLPFSVDDGVMFSRTPRRLLGHPGTVSPSERIPAMKALVSQ